MTGFHHDVCLPHPIVVRLRFTNTIGVSHLDLQVQQNLIYSDSCLGHLHVHRTDNSDPEVRTIFGLFAAETLGCEELSTQRSQQDLRCDGQESIDRRCFCCNRRLPTRPWYSLDFYDSNASRWALNSQRFACIPL